MKKISYITASFFALIALEAKAATSVTLPTDSGLPSSSGGIAGIISNFASWILAIFGFIAIISFVVTGMMYLLSAGDDKAQEKAKKQVQWSIMGVAVGLMGVIIIKALDTLLRGSSTGF